MFKIEAGLELGCTFKIQKFILFLCFFLSHRLPKVLFLKVWQCYIVHSFPLETDETKTSFFLFGCSELLQLDGFNH